MRNSPQSGSAALTLALLFSITVSGQDATTPIRFSSNAAPVQTRWDVSEIVVLRVLRAWYPFNTDRGGWPAAVPTKVDAGFRLYEASIWPDRNSVHLYAFPDTFDPVAATWQEREDHAIATFGDLPTDRAGLSQALRGAFENFFQLIMTRHPDAAFASCIRWTRHWTRGTFREHGFNAGCASPHAELDYRLRGKDRVYGFWRQLC